jgi:hypothetical protein
MLNNAKLKHADALDFLSYQAKVEIFYANCLRCPNAEIRVKTNDKLSPKMSLPEAIELVQANSDSFIIRSCNEDEGYSLEEIVRNTCVLWGKGEHDEGEFIEVNSVEELAYG